MRPIVTPLSLARCWPGASHTTFQPGGLAEHKSRTAAAVDFIQSLPRAEIDQAADREVTFKFRSGAERKFTGRSLLLSFSIPQFFFHVTTAYDLLRHAGVELAKKDFWRNA